MNKKKWLKIRQTNQAETQISKKWQKKRKTNETIENLHNRTQEDKNKQKFKVKK